MVYINSLFAFLIGPCEWSEWSESVCSATCGKGTKTLSRTIAREAEHGGKMCVGEHTKTVECNLEDCPGM